MSQQSIMCVSGYYNDKLNERRFTISMYSNYMNIQQYEDSPSTIAQ